MSEPNQKTLEGINEYLAIHLFGWRRYSNDYGTHGWWSSEGMSFFAALPSYVTGYEVIERMRELWQGAYTWRISEYKGKWFAAVYRPGYMSNGGLGETLPEAVARCAVDWLENHKEK